MSSDDASREVLICGELLKAFPLDFMDIFFRKLSCINTKTKERVHNWKPINAMLYKERGRHNNRPELHFKYYRDSSYTKLIGSVDLSICNHIHASAPKDGVSNIFCLRLQSKNFEPETIHFFSATSNDSMLEWVQTIAHSLDFHNSLGSHLAHSSCMLSQRHGGAAAAALLTQSVNDSLLRLRSQHCNLQPFNGNHGNRLSINRNVLPVAMPSPVANDDDYFKFDAGAPTHPYVNISAADGDNHANNKQANTPQSDTYIKLWEGDHENDFRLMPTGINGQDYVNGDQLTPNHKPTGEMANAPSLKRPGHHHQKAPVQYNPYNELHSRAQGGAGIFNSSNSNVIAAAESVATADQNNTTDYMPLHVMQRNPSSDFLPLPTRVKRLDDTHDSTELTDEEPSLQLGSMAPLPQAHPQLHYVDVRNLEFTGCASVNGTSHISQTHNSSNNNNTSSIRITGREKKVSTCSQPVNPTGAGEQIKSGLRTATRRISCHEQFPEYSIIAEDPHTEYREIDFVSTDALDSVNKTFFE